MGTLNRVFLMGNLTKDPEVRFIPSGKAVCDLRMASNRRFKTANGEDRDETCYVSVVVWGRQAETCGEYLGKGSQVLVEGRLQYDEWEKDGQKHNRLRVVASHVQFMGSPKRAEFRDGRQGPDDAKKEAPAQETSSAGDNAEDDDNLPF